MLRKQIHFLSYFTNVSSTFDNEAEVLPLKSDASVVPLADASGTEGLLFDYNIDLLEAFGLDKNSSPDFQEKYDVTESERIQDVKVYRTTTGICYHRETCPCVGRSKFEMTLTEAADEGFEPCLLCNPPLLTDGGVSNFDAKLELEGKVGLESIVSVGLRLGHSKRRRIGESVHISRREFFGGSKAER